MQTLKRILTMAPQELGHRVRARCYSESERLGIVFVSAAPPCFRTYLADGPASRFYGGLRPGLRDLFESGYPEWIVRATKEAEDLCRHEIRLLNYSPVNVGAPIDWHRDPITGQKWERRFWANYDPEHDAEGRDSKRIHELNRHQHLPRLAKAYWLTSERRYAVEAVQQLNSWIDQNPPYQGINWQSSLEIAIRTISWLWTIFLLRDSEAFSQDAAQRIGDSLFAQLEHVYRHMSTYSSPNTHLIGEASALFIAGIVFRDDRRAARWLEYGAAVLAEQAETQILNDGVYGELSSWYHCYAVDCYLQVLALADQNQFVFAPRVRERVFSMLRFLVHLTRPDSTIPLLGDDDGGRALALANTSYRSFRDGLCTGALIFGCGECKFQAGGLCEEVFWLFGHAGYLTYRDLESVQPGELQANFPNAGYTIQRSGWASDASQLIFDSGGLGICTGGHAHADALSLSFFARGRELLVDPGTFVYNGAPRWREYFRSTRAHNSVSIDGRNQAETGGTFRWNTRWSAKSGFLAERDGIQYVEGEHDGYLTSAGGVIHRRRILHVVGEYWLVADDFRGAGQHTFDFSFHLGPDVKRSGLATHADGFAVYDQQELLLSMRTSGEVTTECLTGSTLPIGGWASAGYGDKKPITSIHAGLNATAPVAAMTFLAPSQSNSALRTLSSTGGNVLCCGYENGGFDDLAVLCLDDRSFEVDGYRMHGEFFWLRREAGTLRQVVAIRARSLVDRGSTVFRQSEAGPHFSRYGPRAGSGSKS